MVSSCGLLAVILALFAGFFSWGILANPPEVSDARMEREAILGPPSASVQIIEYSAYGCFFCKALHDSGEIEHLIETYDDVQYIFRNVPLITENDRLGAEVAQCALDQGDEAFWAIHSAIFALTTEEFVDASESDLIELGGEVGANTAALEICMRENRHEVTVDHWENEGRRAQITSTPTLFVNGQRVDRASLEAAVQAALAAGS